MSKQPFSFPVRFNEELNALNFSYKSIHLMAHHGQWYCNASPNGTVFIPDWHSNHVSKENILLLHEKKKSCTRFHYLCRLVDTNDVVTYDFIHLHDLCEEWAYDSTDAPKYGAIKDPFGFGYSMDMFKRYTFSHIVFHEAHTLKLNSAKGFFSIFARDAHYERPQNQVMSFGREIHDLIDSNKSKKIYECAKASVFIHIEPKGFIAAFFGFCSYSYIQRISDNCVETVSDETQVFYNGDYEKLFYRPC